MARRGMALWAVLILWAGSGPAAAAVRPFVLAGGASTRAEKTDRDEMLDEYTISEHTGSWEAGAGLRFIPGTRSSVSGNSAARLGGDNPIEIRLRLTVGGGGLNTLRISGTRSDYSYRHRFEVSSSEEFRYSSWALGTFFSATVHRRLGFYVGPTLQSVKYTADRAWTGPADCYKCGPAKDAATDRYGALEAGAHYTLRQFPLRLEGFWAPKRFGLSTTHIVKSENYTATFSTLKSSFGARVSWEL